MNATFATEIDRVRRHTSDAAAQAIDAKTRCNVRQHTVSQREMDNRIADLEQEWDVERVLETNAAALALAGAVLGTTVDQKWFLLTGGVLGFLFQHATTGWCPPLPVLRKLGVRTQSEIDAERFALKSIRGDFGTGDGQGRASAGLRTLAETEAAKRGHREPDRVRRYTSASRRRAIDAATAQRIRQYAGQSPDEITERIGTLLREWSIERYLQVGASVGGLTTATLAATKNRRWGWATCTALGFLLLHAVEGFAPPLPLLRRQGVRTRAEINREIYALKILRGDFDDVLHAAGTVDRVEPALAAVGL